MSKNKKLCFGVLGISLVLFTLLSGCNKNDEEVIEVGAILHLTGLGSEQGDRIRKGIDLAVKEINEKRGINNNEVKITYEDNMGDNPSQALTALRKLNSQGIKLIMGPMWSPSAQVLAPVACEEKIVMFSFAGIAEFNEACDYLFNLWPHDFINSELLGEFVVNQGYNKVAIVGSSQVWEEEQAHAVKEGIEKAEGTVIEFLITSREERDFGTEALKIKEAEPDAVVFTNYGYQELTGKKIREIGLQQPFFFVLIDQDKIDGAKGAFENSFAITSFTPSKAFTEKYISYYAEDPGFEADTGYDSMMILAKAIKETESTDNEKIKNYLNSLENYQGASGHLTFDGKGGVTKPPVFLTVKNNKLTSLT